MLIEKVGISFFSQIKNYRQPEIKRNKRKHLSVGWGGKLLGFNMEGAEHEE